jgi:hypothetical protein
MGEESEGETYMPVPLADEDIFENIDPSLLLLCQSFATDPSRSSSYEACDIGLDYDVIETEDLTNLN